MIGQRRVPSPSLCNRKYENHFTCSLIYPCVGLYEGVTSALQARKLEPKVELLTQGLEILRVELKLELSLSEPRA